VILASLQQFEHCALANKWTAEGKDLKLPACLHGVVATHFHALTDAQIDSYYHLMQNLQLPCARCLKGDVLCPFHCPTAT